MQDRERYTLAEAQAHLIKGSNAVMHLVINPEGDYSIMSHIVCYMCDWCYDQEDCRGRPDVTPVPYKENPYEKEDAANAARDIDMERKRKEKK